MAKPIETKLVHVSEARGRERKRAMERGGLVVDQLNLHTKIWYCLYLHTKLKSINGVMLSLSNDIIATI
jgi:hypothetical protein